MTQEELTQKACQLLLSQSLQGRDGQRREFLKFLSELKIEH